MLPHAVSSNEERLARFEREARLLAALNHPNVATIHGLEKDGDTRFLVMELIEGETLAERIARGPLPVNEARQVFRDIATGLSAAHAKDIVHRDLKPANVKITSDGTVKVLDFGLARTFRHSEGTDSLSPTVTRSPTETGVVLGTAAYMSPEQARGKEVDKRSDIWSFGACLFEALSGKSPFQGETISDTFAKILEREPPWETLPVLPTGTRRALERCLRKDAAERLHDIADARLELDEDDDAPASARRGNDWPLRIGLAAVALVAGILLTTSFVPNAPPPEATRWTLDIPSARTRNGIPFLPRLTPDGRTLLVASVSGPEPVLLARGLSSAEMSPVAGTEGVRGSFGFFYRRTASGWASRSAMAPSRRFA